MMLQGRRTRIDELSAGDIGSWRLLQSEGSLTRSPFLTYGFCRAVQDVRGEVFAVALEEGGKTVGYFPFQRLERAIGAGEKVGGYMSDMFDIIGSRNRRFTSDEILRASGLHAFRYDHLPSELSAFCSGETVSSAGMRVRLDDFASYAADLAKKQSKFSASIHRGERQMNTDIGDVNFTFQTSDVTAELERLIAEKRTQYARTGTGDALQPPWTRALLFRFFETELQDLKPILSTLYAGSTWLSTCLCLGYADTLHIWFPAYNTEYRRYSPGNVLFFKMFEYGAAAGYRVFDFGEGVSDYKRRFLSSEYEVLQGANRRKSMRGFLDRALQSIEWRIRQMRKVQPGS